MSTQTLNIALPSNMVKKIDKLAKKQYSNRSELIREALRVYINRLERWDEIFATGRRKAREMGITSEKQINDIVYEFRHGRKPD